MKKLYLFALAAMLFAACATDDTQDLQPLDAPETLTVGFEGGDDNTRVQLNSAGKTVWTKGDLVSVFYRSDANQKWQFQGETGERIADLYRVDAGSATETMRRVVVVYPYNENYYINTETYNVQASLPATQHYLADSYGLDGNLMISSGEYNNISLKSVCGWLKLQLVGNGEKVQSITLKGNNGEQVAGELYINSADATAILSSDKGSGDDGETGGAGGGLVFEDTILKEVTLDCGDGVTLGTEATAFYIALPPQTFEKGVTVEITTTEGKIMGQYTDKEIVIERNTIQPMTELSFEEKIAANQIHYTSSDDTVVTPYKTDVFGANIVSNVCENGKGIITFDNKVTSIGERAFKDCTSLKSVTIPDSVTSIGEGAFSGCTSLKAFYGKFASEDNRCLIVNGTLNAFAIGCGATSYTIPDSVTKIGVQAFSNCESLTSVTIGNGVTSIGECAFFCCFSLTSVTIPDSVTSIGVRAFGYCSSLTSVNIPDSVTSIGDSAFYFCTSLTSVTIPDSVTGIGVSAFSNCTSLKTVYCKSTTPPTGGSNMFSSNASGRKIYVPASDDDSIINAYKAKSGWSNYADYIFEEVEPAPANNEIWYTNGSTTEATTPYKTSVFGANIVSNLYDEEKKCWIITFDGDVTKIGEFAFERCTSLTSVTIPNGVTKIGKWAFCYCHSLTSVTIPDSVTEIGEGAFADCTSLKAFYGKFASEDNRCLIVNGTLNAFAIGCGATSYTIPDSVTSIGEYAFHNCDGMTSITIPNNVTEIEGHTFQNCSNLTSVTIGNGVTEIGCYAFDYCTELTNIVIPDSINSIREYAFSYCSKLTNITIPNSVATIGYGLFEYCSSLTSVIIGKGVTEIGMRAFYDCTSLKEVYCKATTPPTGGQYMFYNNASGRRIFVPASDDDSIINAYKAKYYWSDYNSSIFEYDFSAQQ